MKSIGLFMVLWLFAVPAPVIYSEDSDTLTGLLEKIEELYFEQKHDETVPLIRNNMDKAANASEEGALYWRFSRARFNATETSLRRGMVEEDAIEEFEEGVRLADKAVSRLQSEKGNGRDMSEALFWKSANLGRMGQTQGVLNSLFLVGDMRDLLVRSIRYNPDYANSYYAFGRLLEQLPGGISFGDVDKAVNVGRKSVSLHERDLESNNVPYPFADFYLELAKHLWARNWDLETRFEERRKKASLLEGTTDPLERAYLFEGAVVIPAVSDREEAEDILFRTLRNLEGAEIPEARRERDEEKARGLVSAWSLE